jgi:hypothetical protein
MRMPQLDESLDIAADGSFSMWRSVGSASPLPSPIGSFAGRLSPEQSLELSAAAEQAAAAGSQTRLVSPDSPVDRLRVGDAEATLGIRDLGEGAWRTLAALVRPLLKELTTSPVAAIDLDVGDEAKLVYEGSESLQVDLATLALEAVQWRGDDAVARWKAQDHAEEELIAGPGWSRELPFDHGFELQEGDRISVRATFAARRGERWVPVSLQTP